MQGCGGNSLPSHERVHGRPLRLARRIPASLSSFEEYYRV